MYKNIDKEKINDIFMLNPISFRSVHMRRRTRTIHTLTHERTLMDRNITNTCFWNYNQYRDKYSERRNKVKKVTVLSPKRRIQNGGWGGVKKYFGFN